MQDYLESHEIDAAFAADAFHLYASTLAPSGAVHERLASFRLSEPAAQSVPVEPRNRD